jgi:hypothetical protein
MTVVSLPKAVLTGVAVGYFLWSAVMVVPFVISVILGRDTGIALIVSPNLLVPALAGAAGGGLWYWGAHR